MKTCKICCQALPDEAFNNCKNCPDGLDTRCRECNKKRAAEYSKTKKGLIANIYRRQVRNSKARGHTIPTYTKRELYDWLYSQKQFHIIYDNWKRLDYQKDYIPSVNRLDDKLGYAIANIEIVTWEYNRSKSHEDRRNGTDNRNCKPVASIDEIGKVVKYHSINFAARETGLHLSEISRACNGLIPEYDNKLWVFIQDNK